MIKKKGSNKNSGSDKVFKLPCKYKYYIVNIELYNLKQNIKDCIQKLEIILERIKAILEGIDLSIAETRKGTFDFLILLFATENSRTGKYDVEKLLKYMDDYFKANEGLIDKVTLKNVSIKN